jgi:hypothetical protein
VVPLPRGRYLVTLHFAEIWYMRPRRRVFDIVLEGRPVCEAYDPFAMAEGHAKATTSGPFELTVDDGLLEIRLLPRIDEPKISAVVIDKLP